MPSQRPSIYSGPGLIDLQLNGYAGFDFNSNPAGWTSNDLHRVRDALRRRGVIAAFPTLITDAVENILSRARQYAELVESDAQLETAFPRLHIEGPCISPEDGPRGAHPLAHCLSPVDMPDLVGRLQDASGGRIGILTIAPERPGALEMIRQAASQSICVAIGHTNATAEEIDRAIEAGARMSTHLGNGSHQMLPRLDNYVQTQLAEDRLWASFIADGHHMPFPTLKNFLRAKGLERSVLVTDAIAAAEVGPGRYEFGEKLTIVTPELRVYHPGEPNLAGSALTLDMAVLNVSKHCAIPFETAWELASTRPAQLIGLPTPETVTVRVGEMGFQNENL